MLVGVTLCDVVVPLRVVLVGVPLCDVVVPLWLEVVEWVVLLLVVCVLPEGVDEVERAVVVAEVVVPEWLEVELADELELLELVEELDLDELLELLLVLVPEWLVVDGVERVVPE